MSPTVKGRPTLYKGIQMRSRLEADYAAYLDRAGVEWDYEPTCFAGPEGQWLPDFRVNHRNYAVYVEVKPESLPEDQIDSVLEQMTVTWLTDPAAIVELDIWSYGEPSKCVRITGDLEASPTWWRWASDGTSALWPGMGQLARLILAKCDEIERQQEAAGSPPMVLAEVSRDEHGVTALIAAGESITACGITPELAWWCECGMRLGGADRYVGPEDVCEHLRLLGQTPLPEVS